MHSISLATQGGQHAEESKLDIEIRENRTTFYVYQSLESYLPGD
jgi:hypothetical protein